MKVSVAFWVCVAALCAAVPGEAQLPRPERPYRGLFGGGVGGAGQVLAVNATLGAGYDDNLFADAAPGGGPASTDPRAATGGGYTQLGGSLNYSLERRTFSIGASGGATMRRYPEPVSGFVSAYNGSFGATFRMFKSATLLVSQAVSVQPFIMLRLLPPVFDMPLGQEPVPNLDFETSNTRFVAYDTSADFGMSVGRRGSLSIGASRRFSDLAAGEEQTTLGGRASYSHGLAQGLSARIGYGYTRSRYPALGERSSNIEGQSLDAGLNFNKSLSFSRRTTLSFNTGSTAFADGTRRYYRLTGDARLNHEIGRTWNASVAYSRGAEYAEAFREPLFSDAVQAGLGGLISRRLRFQSGAGASFGAVGFSSQNDNFDTYYASAGLTYGFSRNIGLGVDYFLYRYEFEPDAVLPLGVPRNVNRHGVRAYLTLWAPLIHRARRPDATR